MMLNGSTFQIVMTISAGIAQLGVVEPIDPVSRRTG